MMRAIVAVSLVALAACAPEAPNSAAPKGVGFEDFDAYSAESARREALLQGRPLPGVPATPPNENPVVAALDPQPTPTPVLTTPSVPASTSNSPRISDEQDFSAVSGRETIESDAARINANRSVRQEVAPGALPERPSGAGPNIVAYALATTNAVGQQVYSRSSLRADKKFEKACAEYRNPDQAQAVFLELGGPEKDRKGMDPDGDGFACYWDPSAYRAARR